FHRLAASPASAPVGGAPAGLAAQPLIEGRAPMSQITAADVMKLRDITGMQMMKCKEALVKANGDMDKAIEYIRIEHKNAAVKSATRETTDGRIGAFIDPVAKVGALIEVRCESAPVA